MTYKETSDLLQVEITKEYAELKFGAKIKYEYCVSYNWGLLTRKMLHTLVNEAEDLGGRYEWDFEEFVMPTAEAAEKMKDKIITICM